MNWPWPRGRRGLAGGPALLLAVSLSGCAEALRQPDLTGPGQREAEEAMPELKLFDQGDGANGGSELLAPPGQPNQPPLGSDGD
jgi:hypothetical protein